MGLRKLHCQQRGDDGILVKLFQILKDETVKVMQSICQQIWKTQQWPQDWKRSVFISIPKKGNAKEYSNYHTTALISHGSKVKLKIYQARLQQYVNQELPDIQTAFRKGRGTRDLIPDHLTCIQRNLYAGQKLQLEPDMEQGAGSKLGKEYIGAVYCHPAYLTYMQST